MKRTLTDSLLLSKIRKTLPQKPDLELFDTYSSFVTVTELEFDVDVSRDNNEKNQKNIDGKVDNSTTNIKNKKNSQEKIENESKNTMRNSNSNSNQNVSIPVGGAIRVDWSDGSCATVDGSNGKLLR